LEDDENEEQDEQREIRFKKI